MSRWRRHGHQLSSQWTNYIVLNTQNLDHGTTMEFRQYTGSFGLRRMQLLTGPAVRVSRDVRCTLKILFTGLPNQGSYRRIQLMTTWTTMEETLQTFQTLQTLLGRYRGLSCNARLRAVLRRGRRAPRSSTFSSAPHDPRFGIFQATWLS